jgi:hypothetical protein
MPNPVRVSVSEVRREIYAASGFAASNGAASTPLLGTLFHELFRRVMQPSSPDCWSTVLDADTLKDHKRLREHCWRSIVGPQLRQNQATLQEAAQEVLNFWDATGCLCQYICQLLTNNAEQKALRYDSQKREWVGLEQFSLEEELIWRIEDSRWTAPVDVRGVVDGVWRNPISRRWCVVDLKLGAGSSEADLAQLCLYHAMVSNQETGIGEMSLFHFRPQLDCVTFSGTQLNEVRSRLVDLIGSIAGVTGKSVSKPTNQHQALGEKLVKVLEQFGPVVTLESDPIVGPAFLRFHIMPAAGVKVNKILPLGADLGVQLRLSKPALIRREAAMLVIDVERPDREKLRFADFRGQLPSVSANGNARMLVGVDLNRKPRLLDLSSDCPHVLVVGTAGSGKSEWVRTALASLLATNTPATLRLMLIDPKRVTFQELSQSPFLLDRQANLSTPQEAIQGLAKLSQIMEQRYVALSKAGCTDLESLRRVMGENTPPRIVCLCDEYGNLVAQKKDREKIEMAIVQLGAKARAAGIHLIIATQDPRAQILSPTLKANLAGRVCLKTTSATQSQMMLEETGAEALLGHGDLLFKVTGEPVRLQAPLLDDQERITLFGPTLKYNVQSTA